MADNPASYNNDINGGSGSRLGHVAIVLAGVASLAATLISVVSIWLQFKNYRKPLLQRHVVRILIMVPIYSIASWTSLVSLQAAAFIDPVRDAYEAFTIFEFYSLLVAYCSGERSVIAATTGRPPKDLWPFHRVDISDVRTFANIKRGILQYVVLKPVLALATIIMKATGTYQDGRISATSGYFWSGLIYNVSITASLYCLALFWVIMSEDLKPFRPMPKFLCVKGLVFATYWQGFMLSLFVLAGAIPDAGGEYTPDNLATAIQDALICFEMPAFAVLHWYAFSWHDYADPTVSSARLPIRKAIRDAFGMVDLKEDFLDSFVRYDKYNYRQFESGQNVPHEESYSRVAKMKQGMRYSRNGQGKYWLPKPGEADSKTPLLRPQSPDIDRPTSASSHSQTYGTSREEDLQFEATEDDEQLYHQARKMEYGDFNYPVIVAHFATRDDALHATPKVISASMNRNVFQPTRANRHRRQSEIEDIQRSVKKGKARGESSTGSRGRKSKHDEDDRKGSSSKSDKSQLRDLVIEDKEAEEVDRLRKRRDASPRNNLTKTRRFVHAYSDDEQVEEVLEEPNPEHTLGETQILRENPERASMQWEVRDYSDERHGQDDQDEQGPLYHESGQASEPNVWDSPKR